MGSFDFWVRLIVLMMVALGYSAPLLAAAGSLDTAFGAGGKVITDVANTNDKVTSVIQQADGKLVVAGYYDVGSYSDAFLVRYNIDGSLDTSFDGDGKVIADFGATSADRWNAVIQQADGKLLVAGIATGISGAESVYALARYHPNGTLDTSFDGYGKLTTNVSAGSPNSGLAYAVVQQSDGKLVVAGASKTSASNMDFCLVRYNLDGSLDTTFDGDGKAYAAMSATDDYAYSLVQQSDGKLVLAGSTLNGGASYSDFSIARFNSSGTLDTTFDSDGKVTLGFGSESDIARSIVQQPDGKLVVAGYGYINSSNLNDYAIARLNINGSFDTSFDGDGKLAVSIGDGSDQAYGLVMQPDGKLVAGGWSTVAGSQYFSMVRLQSNGGVDTGFGSSGKITTSIASLNNSGSALLLQTDGKLVLAGFGGSSSTTNNIQLARYFSGLDVDADGYADDVDAFPLNGSEWLDTDSDLLGNNADLDDDGDGVPDYIDAAPLNPAINTEVVLPIDGAFKGSAISDQQAVQ